MSKPKTIGVDITVEEFDAMFDNGESIIDYLDLSSARRPGLKTKPVDVDVPDQNVDCGKN